MARERNPYAKPDAFAIRAKEEGYSARSVYKLSEMDKRFKILRRGQRVVDLGCAPGSWSEYAIERVTPGGAVVGIDLTPVSIPGGTFLVRSIFDITAEELATLLGGKPQVVLSDMAPLTTGARDADHWAQIEIARGAFDVAVDLLAPGGHFVIKIFDGPDAKALELDIRKRFTEFKRAKPEAVRQNSREFYMVALGFKGPLPA